MKMRMMVLISLLLTASCAPMPGNTLFDGLTHPTPVEDVKVTVTTGVDEASQNCNRLFAEQGSYGMIIANCLLNACIWAGCADVQWDYEGDIYSCDIYVASDLFIDHEMRHCLGYADVLY